MGSADSEIIRYLEWWLAPSALRGMTPFLIVALRGQTTIYEEALAIFYSSKQFSISMKNEHSVVAMPKIYPEEGDKRDSLVWVRHISFLRNRLLIVPERTYTFAVMAFHSSCPAVQSVIKTSVL